MSTRYWYQDRSQATVTTTSRWLRLNDADAGVAERAGDARDGARMGALVEQLQPGLDGVAGIVGQQLGIERLGRRHLAPARLQQPAQPALAASAQLHRQRRRTLAHPAALRRRWSTHSSQTSASSWPMRWKLTSRSPSRTVRPQTAHVVSVSCRRISIIGLLQAAERLAEPRLSLAHRCSTMWRFAGILSTPTCRRLRGPPVSGRVPRARADG